LKAAPTHPVNSHVTGSSYLYAERETRRGRDSRDKNPPCQESSAIPVVKAEDGG
jgi:hypothetical protein